MISSYLESGAHHCLNSKVIQQYQIELFGTEIHLSDTNQQRGRQTRPKHHTYKDHKSKLKTQPEKLLHVSEVPGCCYILELSTVSFQRLLLRYFCSYVARGLSRWFAQIRTRGVLITQKRSIFCSENTGHNYLFKITEISCLNAVKYSMVRTLTCYCHLKTHVIITYLKQSSFFVHLNVSPGLERE